MKAADSTAGASGEAESGNAVCACGGRAATPPDGSGGLAEGTSTSRKRKLPDDAAYDSADKKQKQGAEKDTGNVGDVDDGGVRTLDDGDGGDDYNDDNVNDEKFGALVGQDKNRLGDSLAALTPVNNEETHHKMTRDYFLTDREKELFDAQSDWPEDWVSIFFAIGANENGVALAAQPIRPFTSAPFPCIVLTGMDFTKLMDEETAAVSRQLRDFEVEAPEVYREKVPMTYGS